MKKMNVLILGCKEWPYGSSANYEQKVGGGIGKEIKNLMDNYNGKLVHWVVLTRMFPNQKEIEKISENLTVYRFASPKNELFRLPVMNAYFYPIAKKIVTEEKIDILLTHGVFATSLGYLLKKKYQNLLLISKPSGLVCTQYTGMTKKLFEYFENITYSKPDHFIFLSEEEKISFKALTSVKELDKKSKIIPSGMTIHKEIAENYEYNCDHGLKILSIGRLSPVKNTHIVIKAVSQLVEQGFKDVSIEIVGSGTELQKLKKYVKDLDLENTVFLRGFQQELKDYYEKSDVFILGSSSEGCPYAVHEAMAYGLPCIVTDIGLPFPKDTVIIITPRDTTSLVYALKECYKNKKLLTTLSRKSIAYIHKKHSWDTSIKSYESFFKKSLEDHRKKIQI